MLAFSGTILMLLNLILITKFKGKYIVAGRLCTIDMHFSSKKIEVKKLYKNIKKLNLRVISKNIKEDRVHTQLKIISEIKKNEDIFQIKEDIQKMAHLEKITISESVKV